MGLPEARLRPNGPADHATLLRMKAQRVGRAAATTGKVALKILFCGGGLVIALAGSPRRSYDFDKPRIDMERLQRDLRVLESMPKIDFSTYQVDFARHPASLSPSERAFHGVRDTKPTIVK